MRALVGAAAAVMFAVVGCLMPSGEGDHDCPHPHTYAPGPATRTVTSGTLRLVWPEGERELALTEVGGRLDAKSDVAREWWRPDAGAPDAGDASLPSGGPIGEPIGSDEARVAVVKLLPVPDAGTVELGSSAVVVRCPSPLQRLDEGGVDPSGFHCTSGIWTAPVVEPLSGTVTVGSEATTIAARTAAGAVVKAQIRTESSTPPPQTTCY